ncbi:MAG: hypothetical protein J7604_25515 [Sporocytophaga sp.]|uniref:hypothetical protein n=1 Tax=Sporocytophaga sp. TaxID=2231183 RepID=UPI001B10D72B|nr:hypothetical protein [Sporocytophaga sp.]MBO9703588.1 hypothetical protein [Sporocytophaga sp.]
MTTIKKYLKISVSDSKDVTEKTIDYFKKSGFNVSDHKENKLIIKRGSIISNFWTFNSLNWKSEIYIEIKGQEITADFHIDAIGQVITLKEEKLWETFIDNYKLFLIEANFDFKTENQKALNATKRNSFEYVVWVILGGMIGGIPAGLIAYWTGVDKLVLIGAIGGAIALVNVKINDEKKKKSL